MTAGAGARGHRRPGLVPVLPRPAWVVLGADFVSAIGTGTTLPCLFIYAHQVRHLSYGTAGLVVSTTALLSLAGNPAGGALSDRWTARRALMAGLVIAAAGSAALALAHSAAALFVAAGTVGFGVAMAWPAQNALLAGLAGPAASSTVFSVRHATMNGGLALGAFAAAAVVSTSHPGTFVAVFLADAVSFLASVPVLAFLGAPARQAGTRRVARERDTGRRHRMRWRPDTARQRDAAPAEGTGYRAILRDGVFLRVWGLTALLVTLSFGQLQASFTGYATRPGGISAHGLSLAFAANMLAVTGASMLVLRWLAGRRRTTGAALAAATWAVTWAVVIIGGQLGGGVPAVIVFAAAMVIFALGETLLSPTLPAIINDLAPPGAAGRYNGLGALAFTTGFLLGPAIGGAALGAGMGTALFVALIAGCGLACLAALRLGRQLPSSANQIDGPAGASAPEVVPTGPVPAEPGPVEPSAVEPGPVEATAGG
jgi:MFS family permease